MTPDSPHRDEALSRYLDGEPEPGDAEALAAAMREDPAFAAEVARLLATDDLLRQSHEPDSAAFVEALGARLAADEDGDPFVRSVMGRIDSPLAASRAKSRAALRWVGTAAVVVIGIVIALRPWHRPNENPEIAWLTNAQDCRWVEGGQPSGGLTSGKVVRLEQGLAEVSFANGVRAVLQGPVELEVRSVSSVRLVRGGMSVRVPEGARGFEVLSPGGKVIDLGTEFGIRVGDDGSTRVQVFRGEVKVEADDQKPASGLSVKETQSAHLDKGSAALVEGPAADVHVAREIAAPAVPHSRRLDFRGAIVGTLLDIDGFGTGLTHRLPGTGKELPDHDPNLQLDAPNGRLRLTTTENDLNKQYKVGQGEYVGLRLADLGFRAGDDFAVSAVFPAAPALDSVDQFGLYVGSRSDRHIRGGLMRSGQDKGIGPATQFFVGNDGGPDANLHMVGMVPGGDTLTMTLQRIAGKYSLTVENKTTGESTTLTIRHPGFLDAEADLYVGVFGATPWRPVPRTLEVQELTATVWVRKP